jgi:Arc/MetJ family transcription regulator
MRTTVNIDDALLEQAKHVAASTHRRLGDVIDDALRVLLAERHQRRDEAIALPTFGGSGLQPGVDLEDKDSLAALLGDDQP